MNTTGKVLAIHIHRNGLKTEIGTESRQTLEDAHCSVLSSIARFPGAFHGAPYVRATEGKRKLVILAVRY